MCYLVNLVRNLLILDTEELLLMLTYLHLHLRPVINSGFIRPMLDVENILRNCIMLLLFSFGCSHVLLGNTQLSSGWEQGCKHWVWSKWIVCIDIVCWLSRSSSLWPSQHKLHFKRPVSKVFIMKQIHFPLYLLSNPLCTFLVLNYLRIH